MMAEFQDETVLCFWSMRELALRHKTKSTVRLAVGLFDEHFASAYDVDAAATGVVGASSVEGVGGIVGG
jgi:hypothetical protein